jgi:hypothetical protein
MKHSADQPINEIRAVYSPTTIRVYQAYSQEIAESALRCGTFVSPPFKMGRMTWIKPSFLWMMYRAGWGFKEPGQAHILAIDISRDGFAWALTHSCASQPDPHLTWDEWQRLKRERPVRIQWDPERDLLSRPLARRSIQIGLSGTAVDLYVHDWIKSIAEITPLAHAIHDLITRGEPDAARELVPQERPYPLPSLATPGAA